MSILGVVKTALKVIDVIDKVKKGSEKNDSEEKDNNLLSSLLSGDNQKESGTSDLIDVGVGLLKSGILS